MSFTSPHQYSAIGKICRPPTDECDLPEYCNGSSAMCQDNFFVQNGHPCGDNQWLCLNGTCISGIKQCTAVFGEGIYYNFISHICVFLDTKKIEIDT